MRRAILTIALWAVCGAARAFDATPLLQWVTAGSTWTPASLGPVAWYKGDGTATDAMGAYNGTWLGTPAYATGVNGQAFSFDASNTVRLMQTNAVALDAMLPTNGFSVAVWAKATSTNGYVLWAAQGGETIRVSQRMSVLNISSQIELNALGQSFAPTGTTLNQFRHYTITAAAGSPVKFYTNGVLASISASNGVPLSADNFAIGGRAGDANFTSSAVRHTAPVDDVIIVNRVLTPAEITQLYNWRQP